MIDRQEVKKVANLARLNITEAEEEAFTTQLNSILDYFEQLSEFTFCYILQVIYVCLLISLTLKKANSFKRRHPFLSVP